MARAGNDGDRAVRPRAARRSDAQSGRLRDRGRDPRARARNNPPDTGRRPDRAANELKGSLSNLTAHQAAAAAQQPEALGRTGDPTRAGEAFCVLETPLARLSPLLIELATYTSAPPCSGFHVIAVTQPDPN